MLGRLSPTQRLIFDLLSDGRPHPRVELIEFLKQADHEKQLKSLHHHLAQIRARLRPHKRDIICQLLNKRINYRYVQLVVPPSWGNGANSPRQPLGLLDPPK